MKEKKEKTVSSSSLSSSLSLCLCLSVSVSVFSLLLLLLLLFLHFSCLWAFLSQGRRKGALLLIFICGRFFAVSCSRELLREGNPSILPIPPSRFALNGNYPPHLLLLSLFYLPSVSLRKKISLSLSLSLSLCLFNCIFCSIPGILFSTSIHIAFDF